MNYKIFFAYQTDINEIYNKKFIIEAFDKVIIKFKKETINIELDFGMRNTSGNSILIEEMLNKSQNADLVIADMTFTSAKEWLNAKTLCEDDYYRWVEIPKTDRKPSPNPNVLLEIGYAWAQKGKERTIFLMNTAFGIPEELQVDFKGIRWPILYNLNDTNYSEVKFKRDELANDLYKAIKTAINSEAEYQSKKWQPMRLYKDWTPKDYQTTYQLTKKLKEIITQLRIDLENTSTPQRIIGSKNSGKTRLIYELYNQLDNSLPKHENLEKILYYDLDGDDFNSIETQIQNLKSSNQRKIIILDNCSAKIHKRVFNEYFYDTNISLLTISNQCRLVKKIRLIT